jgi:segregation and condensation protein A
MEQYDLYIAAEFIDMVAKLLYIKSKLLLPKDENEPDPREELVKILLDYSEIRTIAEYLSGRFDEYKNRYEKPPDNIIIYEDIAEEGAARENTEIISPSVLYDILMDIAARKKDNMPPSADSVKILTNKKIITLAGKAISIMRRLYKQKSLGFLNLLRGAGKNAGTENRESREDIVATFAAILELLRTNRINIEGENILECRFSLNREKQN